MKGKDKIIGLGICSQVLPLEISKRLKELGLSFKGAFTYVLCTDTGEYKLESFGYFNGAIHNYRAAGFDGRTKDGVEKFGEMFHAYTAEELMQVIPAYIDSSPVTIRKYANDDYAVYYTDTPILPGKTLAEALGKTLIYLLENSKIPSA